MGLIRSFTAAIGLLTILPASPHPLPEGMGGRVARLFPAVGLFMGGLTCAAIVSMRFLRQAIDANPSPNSLAESAIALTLLTLLTGALHLDGLSDTCDGMATHRTREEALSIMRDSRTGSFGVAGMALALLLKFAILSSLPVHFMPLALLTAVVAGRFAMTVACAKGDYARKGGGMGGYFIDNTTWRHALQAGLVPALLIFALPLACSPSLRVGAAATLAFIAPAGAALLLTRFFHHRLGGITGDTLGATNEAGEAIALLVLYLSCLRY